MHHAHRFILFVSACSIAILIGQLPTAINASPSQGFVSTFISADIVKQKRRMLQHSHAAFNSYQSTSEEGSIFDRDDDGFGVRDDALQQRNRGSKEISPYFKQDRREFDAHGSPIFSPVSDPIGLANLLQQRHMALLSENEMYEQVARIDQRLKDEYNVVVYSHPPIWSRFDFNAPPDAIRKQQIQKEVYTLQRAFGPTGHPYQRVGARESSFLDCDLSMTQIHDLLSQYTKYKCTFQPELADATLFELKLHGVRLSDRTFQWTTDPFCDIDSIVSEPTSITEKDDDLHSTTKTNLFNRIRRNRSQAVVGRQTNSQYLMMMDGIDHVTVEGNSTLSKSHPQIQQVGQLLRDRLMALHREEHDLVAWITYELFCTFGVTVNDTTKQWAFVSDTMNPTTGMAIPPSPPASPSLKALSVLPILFGNDGHFYNSATRYHESRRSQSPPDLPEAQRGRIAALVQERIQKREEGKFQEADTIRTILWHTYNVGINDRLQEYSFGGLFGDEE